MISKKKTQQSHAKKRVFERYGMSLKDQEYRELCSLLKKGNGKTLAKQSRTRSIKYIKYKESDFYVIYDKLRHQIATFLTKEMAEETAKDYNPNFKKEEKCQN